MTELPDDDPAGASAGPVHPDDRLWRHPSELGQSGLGTPVIPASAANRSAASGSTATITRRPQVAAAMLYGTVAVLLMGGVWWAADEMNGRQPERSISLASTAPSSTAIATVAQLRQTADTVPRASSIRLGVAVHWTPAGIVIIWIGDESPAEIGGLEVGDVIISVDGTTAATPDDLIQMVHRRHRDDTMSMKIRRNGLPMTCSITIDSDD